MKNFLLFGILMVFANFAISQVTFEQTYDNGSVDVGTSVISLSDGYIMCGATMDDVNGDFDIFVTKTDLNGDVLWTNIYSDVSAGDDYATYINATTDGNFIITGTTTDVDTDEDDVFILKISSTGTEIWGETYDGGNAENDGANYIVETSANTYLVAGYSFDGTYSDMWILEVNEDGTFEWENFYGLNGNDEAYSVMELDDGIAIVGQSYDDTNGDLDGVLIKTDTNGDEAWTVYTTGTADEIYNDFILDDAGDFLIVGAQENEANGDDDILIVNISADGNTLYYAKTYDYNLGDDEAVKVYYDGTDYFLVGSVDFTGSEDYDAYIASIDYTNGDITGEEHFGDIYDEEFLDFDFTDDGGFICIGYQEVDNAGNMDIYLVKTDENEVTTTNELTRNENVKIYPNPVNDILNIETNFNASANYTIKNIAGQEIQNGVLNNSINVNNLEQGVYFIEITNENKTYTNKFIKQ